MNRTDRAYMFDMLLHGILFVVLLAAFAFASIPPYIWITDGAGEHMFWTCLPPYTAGVVLTVMNILGWLVRPPQQPLANSLTTTFDGPVVQAECWGRGWWGLFGAFSLAAAGFAAGLAGAPLGVTLTIATLAVATALPIAVVVARLHRSTELRLTAHALEVWVPRVRGQSLQHRHRIGLHEIREISVKDIFERYWKKPKGADGRLLRIVDDRGERFKLPLPMTAEDRGTFVDKLREMVALAREYPPDADTIEQMEKLTQRAVQPQ